MPFFHTIVLKGPFGQRGERKDEIMIHAKVTAILPAMVLTLTSLVIAAVQGIICGGAFAIVGVGSPLFWGVVMAFLSLLPVVGAWPVWILAAIWLFSTGHAARALLLVGVCGGLGSTIDNILRPVLLGGRSSLNGLLVFISVLGGIAVFGALGVVLGPIVVATAVGVLDVYSEKEIRNDAAAVAE